MHTLTGHVHVLTPYLLPVVGVAIKFYHQMEKWLLSYANVRDF